MGKLERIGTTEYMPIRAHANTLYLPLKRTLCGIYDLKKGDVLRVKIEGVQRVDQEVRK